MKTSRRHRLVFAHGGYKAPVSTRSRRTASWLAASVSEDAVLQVAGQRGIFGDAEAILTRSTAAERRGDGGGAGIGRGGGAGVGALAGIALVQGLGGPGVADFELAPCSFVLSETSPCLPYALLRAPGPLPKVRDMAKQNRPGRGKASALSSGQTGDIGAAHHSPGHPRLTNTARRRAQGPCTRVSFKRAPALFVN